MYFFIFIIIFFVLIPSYIENKYPIIIYLKIFISGIVYFYLLGIENKTILNMLYTILVFVVISILIYRLLKNDAKQEIEDNSIFNLAHEVKNPITVCKGYLDMIDVDDKEKINNYLPIIKNEMNRALTVMDEFLNLKRVNLNKDIMDFSLLLEDIKDTINLVLDNNDINFNIPKTDKEIIMNGDYDKLKQVLINLIKNSYEAESKNIKITMKINNNRLMVKIIDDGKGITKEDLTRIGEIFYTTKVNGTGIGVNLSKQIIELHDGSLSYKSVINKGTTVTIILPIEYIF